MHLSFFVLEDLLLLPLFDIVLFVIKRLFVIVLLIVVNSLLSLLPQFIHFSLFFQIFQPNLLYLLFITCTICHTIPFRQPGLHCFFCQFIDLFIIFILIVSLNPYNFVAFSKHRFHLFPSLLVTASFPFTSTNIKSPLTIRVYRCLTLACQTKSLSQTQHLSDLIRSLA